jgi:ribonuclease-3
MEAVIGAVYLDGGLRACARVVRRFLFLAGPSGDQGGGIHNPKGLLQQASQALWRKGPEYKVLEMTGPSHDRRFCVGVALPDGTAASGTGASRRGAEVCAATEALKLLVERGVIPDPSPKDGK